MGIWEVLSFVTDALVRETYGNGFILKGFTLQGINRERIHLALRSLRPQGRRKGFHRKRRGETCETTGWIYWTYWTYWCLFFIFFIASVLRTVHAKDIRLP